MLIFYAGHGMWDEKGHVGYWFPSDASKNEEKFLTSELLFSSFKRAIMNNSSNIPQFGVSQNAGDEGGDFIFIRK